MANEIGSTLLNSLTRSTFDIGNMAKTLAEAEVAGQRSIVERGQEKTNTELDALKYLQTNLEAFNTYVADLSSPDVFGQKQATSSNDSVVAVSAQDGAVAGSYQIQSNQLAQASTVVANQGFTSASDPITYTGTEGTLSLQVGGQTQDIIIDQSNNTLEGLQKVINNGDYGVNASIINNGGSYQMMFSAKQTGAASEVSLTSTDVDFVSAGFTTTSQAQDAVMTLNGLTVSSDTNQFDDVIDGLNFQLKSAAPGVSNTVGVAEDRTQVKEAVGSFVEVYNQLNTIVDELGSYNKGDLTQAELESEEFQYFGDLAGNSLLRSVTSQIRSSLSGTIDELSGNSLQSLGDIGLSFDRDGAMQLDNARLDSALATNIDAVANLFAKGGSSSDALVNVSSGSDNTQTGNYDLNVTQLATRAQTTGANVTGLTTDERVAGGLVTDQNAALNLDATAGFTLTTGNNGAQTFDLNSLGLSGDYASKSDLVTAVQNEIDTAFGATDVVNFAYDASQSRFEFSAGSGVGSLEVSGVTGMANQGLSAANYSGEALLNVANPAQFDIAVDGSTASTVNIDSGRYTLNEMNKVLADRINANSDVQAANAEVSVANDGSAFTLSSNRFGGNSSLAISNASNTAAFGVVNTAEVNGQNVDGTLETDSGFLNIGAYADQEDGRKVSISDFAVIGGEPAEVRGLQFEVLGGATGDRGQLTFSQGFASQLETTINNLFEGDTGLVSQRIESLSSKVDGYAEKNKDLDARYEQLLLKYQVQFSSLQTLLSNSEQTRDMLSSTFSNDN